MFGDRIGKKVFQVTDGWLEPLLDIVAKNSSVIACPVIDTIQDDTFEYMVRMHAQKISCIKKKIGIQPDTPFQHKPAEWGVSWVGGFTWSLTFTWHPLPPRLRYIIYIIFIIYIIHFFWRHFHQNNILPGLLLPHPLFPPPRWPAVCLQSPATSFSNWAATTQASISGEGRISS